ncbi:hypothetical protein EC912_101109 [Luteibacter rhizovicinus]|uniref:EF-hand domain-containing protein n=1 Tax=Luteibacter rhizovicinus TaxID=242606 RepID=A0A4R3YZY8_9GAMM|nr:EF-hand domain-containing protein [Luteibacter rhizovicinus]TCV97114.1 hypothetical protein EC912_101109 [Luteibacter rhizovicinus]
MKRQYSFMIALLATTLAFAAQAQAATPGTHDVDLSAATDGPVPAHPKIVPSFESLDKDHDGYIRRADIPKDEPRLAELRAHFDEAWPVLDKITAKDYYRYLARREHRRSAPVASQRP